MTNDQENPGTDPKQEDEDKSIPSVVQEGRAVSEGQSTEGRPQSGTYVLAAGVKEDQKKKPQGISKESAVPKGSADQGDTERVRR